MYLKFFFYSIDVFRPLDILHNLSLNYIGWQNFCPHNAILSHVHIAQFIFTFLCFATFLWLDLKLEGAI